MILISKYLVPKGYRGIALFPFIVLRQSRMKDDPVLINHEKIHLRQQLELLVIPFFIWYGLEFLIRYLKYRNWRMAYSTISFEREAYKNEKDLNYLKSRSWYGFLGCV